MWEQLEFDFSEPKRRKFVDYDMLYNRLKKGPVTFNEIMEITGLSKVGTAQCITTLTLKYPVWCPSKGVYKLCESSDYKTVDWSKLEED